MKFSSQLQKIMHHFKLSTTELADKISVPKATISHLISERNKPSLEFIMKLHTNFPTLNLEWLIYAKEPFLLEDIAERNDAFLIYDIPALADNLDQNETEIHQENIPEDLPKTIVQTEEKSLSYQTKQIESIVIFYNDGSFKQYNP